MAAFHRNSKQKLQKTLKTDSPNKKTYESLEAKFNQLFEENFAKTDKSKNMKVEIEKKFLKSIRNRSYSFPRQSIKNDNVDYNSLDYSSSSSLNSIRHVTTYNLHTQNSKDIPGPPNIEITSRLIQGHQNIQFRSGSIIEASCKGIVIDSEDVRVKNLHQKENEYNRISYHPLNPAPKEFKHVSKVRSNKVDMINKRLAQKNMSKEDTHDYSTEEILARERSLEKNNPPRLVPSSSIVIKEQKNESYNRQNKCSKPKKMRIPGKDQRLPNNEKRVTSKINNKSMSTTVNKVINRDLSVNKPTDFRIKLESIIFSTLIYTE